MVLFGNCATAQAAEIDFLLLDKQGNSFGDAVVWLSPQFDSPKVLPEEVAKMVQVNKQFFPHILVVQKGGLVSFPNRDDIKHHVFSFSPTKTFELKLYKDVVEAPLSFNNTGDVEIGCNIHDWMLGYIKVVDSHIFAKTDTDGHVSFDNLPAGQYALSIWHPRILNETQGIQMSVDLASDLVIEHTLVEELAPPLFGFENFEQDAEYN
jgi:hypothetical protein